MGNFLSTDGKLMENLGKASDTVLLGVLWLICCIPIITIGASTTAAYYTYTKVIKRQTGSLLQQFFHAFKGNLRDGFILNLCFLLVQGILGFNIYETYKGIDMNSSFFQVALLFLYVLLMAIAICSAFYCYAFLSRFEQKAMTLFRIAIHAAMSNMLNTLGLFAAFLVMAVVIVVFPIGIIFLPGIFLWVYYCLLEPLLRKYMTPEMLEAWDEDYLDEQFWEEILAIIDQLFHKNCEEKFLEKVYIYSIKRKDGEDER